MKKGKKKRSALENIRFMVCIYLLALVIKIAPKYEGNLLKFFISEFLKAVDTDAFYKAWKRSTQI